MIQNRRMLAKSTIYKNVYKVVMDHGYIYASYSYALAQNDNFSICVNQLIPNHPLFRNQFYDCLCDILFSALNLISCISFPLCTFL